MDAESVWRCVQLLHAGRAADVLEHLGAEAETPRDRSVASLAALAALRLGDFSALESPLAALPPESALATLIRMRAALATGDLNLADSLIERPELPADERLWSRFVIAVARAFPTADLEDDATRIRLETLILDPVRGQSGSEREVVNQFLALPESGAMALLLEVGRALRGLSDPRRSAPRQAARELADLAARLTAIAPQGQELRCRLIAAAVRLLAGLGERAEARRIAEALLAEAGPEGAGSDALLAWASLLVLLGASEEESIEAYRRAHERFEAERHRGRCEGSARTARALALTYAACGRTSEARAILHGLLAGRSDPELRAELRAVLTIEALGFDPAALTRVIGNLAPTDTLLLDSAPAVLDKPSLSILFLKAEECFARLGPELGAEVLDSARELKRRLKEKDSEGARQAEARLARLVTRLLQEHR